MMGGSIYSAAGNALGLNSDAGLGGSLSKQVQDQVEEERKKRMRTALAGSFSPAGVALMGSGVF